MLYLKLTDLSHLCDHSLEHFLHLHRITDITFKRHTDSPHRAVLGIDFMTNLTNKSYRFNIQHLGE